LDQSDAAIYLGGVHNNGRERSSGGLRHLTSISTQTAPAYGGRTRANQQPSSNTSVSVHLAAVRSPWAACRPRLGLRPTARGRWHSGLMSVHPQTNRCRRPATRITTWRLLATFGPRGDS
jgi:hypothetical protein